MRRSNTQKIGEVLREYIEHMMIGQKLRESSVLQAWEELMGKTVASRTKSIYIRNRVLFIHLTSSVLRSELSMMQQAIMDKLNEQSGEKTVDKIVFK